MFNSIHFSRSVSPKLSIPCQGGLEVISGRQEKSKIEIERFKLTWNILHLFHLVYKLRLCVLVCNHHPSHPKPNPAVGSDQWPVVVSRWPESSLMVAAPTTFYQSIAETPFLLGQPPDPLMPSDWQSLTARTDSYLGIRRWLSPPPESREKQSTAVGEKGFLSTWGLNILPPIISEVYLHI